MHALSVPKMKLNILNRHDCPVMKLKENKIHVKRLSTLKLNECSLFNRRRRESRAHRTRSAPP